MPVNRRTWVFHFQGTGTTGGPTQRIKIVDRRSSGDGPLTGRDESRSSWRSPDQVIGVARASQYPSARAERGQHSKLQFATWRSRRLQCSFVTDTIVIKMGADVTAAFPESRIALITVSGLCNESSWDNVDDLIATTAAAHYDSCLRLFTDDDPTIRCWHEAYRSFGVNPRRMRPSVDALGRRFAKTGRLPRINPAVDAYNIVSLLTGLPAGAIDLNHLPTDRTIELRGARAGDHFVPIGATVADSEEPSPGEVVYTAGSEVLTRAWNHRDCDRTKVTEASRSVAFLFERIDRTAVTDAMLDDAARLFASLVTGHADKITTSFVEP